jgi:hypothetical protein
MTMGTQSTAYYELSESVHLDSLLEWPETHEVVEDLITDDARHFKALLAGD